MLPQTVYKSPVEAGLLYMYVRFSDKIRAQTSDRR